MRIIEVNALSNGAHRNQSGDFKTAPSGWAMIPDDMVIPDTFPFVNIEVDGQVVTSMTEGIVPEVVVEREPEKSAQDDTDAMLVDLEYRVTLLELGISEEV